MPVSMFDEFGFLKMPIHAPFCVVLGDMTPRWDTISTILTKVECTGDSGFSGILFMLVSLVVPEKLPGQKRCDEEDKEEEKEKHDFWAFLTSF